MEYSPGVGRGWGCSVWGYCGLSFCLQGLKSPFSSSFRIFLELLLQQEQQRLRRQTAEAALYYNSIILKADVEGTSS